MSVCPVAVEVGPGHTSLRSVMESPPGGGPLPALVAGWQALAADGWRGPVLAVATDLPRLTSALLEWLCGYPGDRSVVPVAGGRVQPLCARYTRADMEAAAELVGRGERAMRALLEATSPVMVGEDSWSVPAGDPRALDDADTPEDFERATGE